MKKIFILSFLVLFIFSCKQNEPVEFIILQMNDVYEIAPVEGGKAGGMARVATLRNQLLEENPHVITTLSGDFVSPSLIGTLTYQGEKIALSTPSFTISANFSGSLWSLCMSLIATILNEISSLGKGGVLN